MFDFVATMLTLREEPFERELFYQTQCKKKKEEPDELFSSFQNRKKVKGRSSVQIHIFARGFDIRKLYGSKVASPMIP